MHSLLAGLSGCGQKSIIGPLAVALRGAILVLFGTMDVAHLAYLPLVTLVVLAGTVIVALCARTLWAYTVALLQHSKVWHTRSGDHARSRVATSMEEGAHGGEKRGWPAYGVL